MNKTATTPARKPAVVMKPPACKPPRKTVYGKRVAELLLSLPADLVIRSK